MELYIKCFIEHRAIKFGVQYLKDSNRTMVFGQLVEHNMSFFLEKSYIKYGG